MSWPTPWTDTHARDGVGAEASVAEAAHGAVLRRIGPV